MPVTNKIFSQFSKPTLYTAPEQPAKKQPEIQSEKKTTGNFNFSKTEKKQLATAGIITLSGIMIFAGRGFIARKLFKKPEVPVYKPLENLVDDTLQQAREVINDKYGNEIASKFYNDNTEEIIKAHRLADGKALTNLSRVLTFKRGYLNEIDDKTYVELMERYMEEIFQKGRSIEVNEPSMISEMAKAYYNTQNKEKAFNLLQKADDRFDQKWIKKYFINTEIILQGKEKNYEKVLEIFRNKNCEYSDDAFHTIMKSITEVNNPEDCCEWFEIYFPRDIYDMPKSFDYYLNLSLESGRKQQFFGTITNIKYLSTKQLFEVLTKNKEKLALDEKTSNLLNLYNELYANERKIGFDKPTIEIVDKSIEIYTKAKDTEVITVQEAENILSRFKLYKENPTEENYNKHLLYIKISSMEEEHPFAKKMVEYLTED